MCYSAERLFRDPIVAATLKQVNLVNTLAKHLPFPRPHRRGHIEACRASNVTTSWAALFRDPIVAATLKPRFIEAATSQGHPSFPPPHRRGHIEALASSSPCLATFNFSATPSSRPH